LEGLKGSKNKQLIFQFLPSRAYLFGVQSSSHIAAAYVHIFCGVWMKCPRKRKKQQQQKVKYTTLKISSLKQLFGCYWAGNRTNHPEAFK